MQIGILTTSVDCNSLFNLVFNKRRQYYHRYWCVRHYLHLIQKKTRSNFIKYQYCLSIIRTLQVHWWFAINTTHRVQTGTGIHHVCSSIATFIKSLVMRYSQTVKIFSRTGIFKRIIDNLFLMIKNFHQTYDAVNCICRGCGSTPCFREFPWTDNNVIDHATIACWL